MAANTVPIFPLTPLSSVGNIVGGTGVAKSDGTGTAIGTDMIKLATAGADGAYIESVQFTPSASAVGTSTTATVLRVYVSNKTSGATTTADTTLIGELTAASVSAASATVATTTLTLAINRKIAANLTILASSHVTNAASTSWSGMCYGASY